MQVILLVLFFGISMGILHKVLDYIDWLLPACIAVGLGVFWTVWLGVIMDYPNGWSPMAALNGTVMFGVPFGVAIWVIVRPLDWLILRAFRPFKAKYLSKPLARWAELTSMRHAGA